ncbi:MAG: helix-turn-helix domain-containing protein [Firmicutes bacterium]|nr:helix-turn-helix domain-containing protein [Bacillota bacterium]
MKAESHTIGAKIRALRIARGLTQTQLTGGMITPGLISQIESDRVAPSARVVALLAEQLGVSPTELQSDVSTRTAQVSLYREAKELLSQGRGAEALQALSRLRADRASYVPSLEVCIDEAYAHHLAGNVLEARRLYASAESQAFLQREHSALGRLCATRQGSLFMEQNQLPLALFSYARALMYAREEAGVARSVRAMIHRNIAVCCYRMGNPVPALEHAEAAYACLDRRQASEELAATCHMLSVLCTETGQADRALRLAVEAVGLYRALGNEALVIDAKLNQAIILRELGNCQSALRMLPDIINEYYKSGRQAGLANAWNERALCECTLGLYDAALLSVERSRTICPPNSVEHIEWLRVDGIRRVAVGDHAGARSAWTDALTRARDAKLLATAADIASRLVELQQATGDRLAVLAARADQLDLRLALDALREWCQLHLPTAADESRSGQPTGVAALTDDP